MSELKSIAVSIPSEWKFADLELAREPVTGSVSWKLDALAHVISQDDVNWLMSHHEDHASALLVRIYYMCRARGDPPDPVVEQLLAEVIAADQFGAVNVQFSTGTKQ